MRRNQIDYAPIVQRIEALGGIDAALSAANLHHDDNEYRKLQVSYLRCSRRGTGSVFHVDELCVRILRAHPSELYGREWFDTAHLTAADDEWVERWANGFDDETEVAA
jgi:hypothetical protein